MNMKTDMNMSIVYSCNMNTYEHEHEHENEGHGHGLGHEYGHVIHRQGHPTSIDMDIDRNMDMDIFERKNFDIVKYTGLASYTGFNHYNFVRVSDYYSEAKA
jgi:hypothetical protein